CTHSTAFSGFDGQTVRQVDMMSQTKKHDKDSDDKCLQYYETENATGFRKSYKDGYTFYAILPKKTGLDQFDKVDVDEFMNSSDTSRYEITVKMPRFEIDYLDEVDKRLEKNGFGKIKGTILKDTTEAGLKIQKIKQRCVIKTNEEGTTAAAVTAQILQEVCMLEDPWPERKVVLDRPFEYIIADETTGNILFMGIYTGK
ncbi:MAG: hypothetical protein IKN54_04100, partial [Lachnospiraceae bacterium]|nr:hypothetical protein [Lachnospiraceae bacterium]